jgi:hypothetical protein
MLLSVYLYICLGAWLVLVGVLILLHFTGHLNFPKYLRWLFSLTPALPKTPAEKRQEALEQVKVLCREHEVRCEHCGMSPFAISEEDFKSLREELRDFDKVL